MSFSFPARYTESYFVHASPLDSREAVIDAIDSLGWTIREETESFVFARVGLNFWSWGEQISVRFLRDGRLNVSSKCALTTQCFDWGKNQSNVTMLISEVHRLLGLRRFARHEDGNLERTRASKTTKIVETPEGPAALLPEGFRFEATTVAIYRDGVAVILEPLKPANWTEGFFEKIRIDDPTFKRPDQGDMPPAPAFD